MAINTTDGLFQACYWRDAARIGEAPDALEFSDFAMELKQRIHALFKQGEFAHAAIFQWNAGADAWELVDEFGRGDSAP